MGFKFMKVSNHLCGEADITVITTILVYIIMVIELFFRFKCLMAGFALKGFLGKLLTVILVFTGDSLTGWWKRVEAAIKLGNDRPKVGQKVAAVIGLVYLWKLLDSGIKESCKNNLV